MWTRILLRLCHARIICAPAKTHCGQTCSRPQPFCALRCIVRWSPIPRDETELLSIDRRVPRPGSAAFSFAPAARSRTELNANGGTSSLDGSAIIQWYDKNKHALLDAVAPALCFDGQAWGNGNARRRVAAVPGRPPSWAGGATAVPGLTDSHAHIMLEAARRQARILAEKNVIVCCEDARALGYRRPFARVLCAGFKHSTRSRRPSRSFGSGRRA